ncbi:MAG TPA: hypothetical protein VKU60_07980, partial [Chloroflexota bacterium]|nr:hypothetical protein [Chloroflexota bacterium]
MDETGEHSYPGLGHRACDPDTAIHAALRKDGKPDPWHAGTGSVLAVTCALCKETEAFQAAVLASRR